MTPLDVAAVRLSLLLAGAGAPRLETGTLAILATWARDHGPDEVARWIAGDPGWIICPSANLNQYPFAASLLQLGRFQHDDGRTICLM